MLQPISQTEEAFRDTLITKAEGAAFDRLARMWGFPRLGSISISAWRKGLRATALGPRGTPGAIHEAIDGILSGGVVSVTVDQAIANPSRITASAGGPFTADHVGRLVRVAGRLYYSTSFAATYLELATVGTALWDAAAWTVDVSGLTAEVLPYIYHDGARPGELHLFSGSLAYATPPTYLLASGEVHPGAPRPLGGHIQPDEFTADDPATGPWPLYLVGDALDELAARLRLITTTGGYVRAWSADWSDWSTP
jgi:hypothetical protein